MSERCASLEKVDAQADPAAIPGKVDTAGKTSEEYSQSLCRGSGDSMYIREARATREAPWRDQRWSTGRPRGTGRAPWGGGEARSTEEAG